MIDDFLRAAARRNTDHAIVGARNTDERQPLRRILYVSATSTSTIVAYEIVGFLAIIALSWLNELLGVPSLIFGSDHLGGWHESLVETAIILLVAIPVVVLPRRLVTRLHYLEEFLRLCAWCRKLHMDNEWIPVEEFLQRRFDTRTSHGICPACRAEQRKAAGARRAS